jgi:3'-phosphoadenosine 5'-phosphosulfate sulfotransferase (PAPS reductase)/FAD synthetase
MSIELIKRAIEKGGKIYSSISGGKDGQAMTKTLVKNGFQIEGLIHADLGRVEWKESMGMCEKLSQEFNVPLHIVRRTDGRDMIDHWKHRLNQLKGTGKPFWSSANERYCTSDLKRDPIDKFFRNCGNDLIISCEGIRAQESKKRAAKKPLTIRKRITSKHYAGMTVEEAIENFKPGERLGLTWYPIFNFSKQDVWQTYGMDQVKLEVARGIYKNTGIVLGWWSFHPAYVFGNERVSCKFCVLACIGDLITGAKHDEEGVLDEMIQMEEEGQATFRYGFSLKQLQVS